MEETNKQQNETPTITMHTFTGGKPVSIVNPGKKKSSVSMIVIMIIAIIIIAFIIASKRNTISYRGEQQNIPQTTDSASIFSNTDTGVESTL
ncbi:MAG: hypothetical protein KBB88_01575 [Candidatus Pacebacteria bacterium]|nr:hypothetical protein [Candidatus Paceibacterota bacterium]